jgi:hypothetical protein
MSTSTQRLGKGAELRSSSAKERHALLQRVLWSHRIANSERIRDFLLYVCERAFREPNAEIHEQEIGYRVFGRKPDYDTAADNIVRVTVSQARKKLEQYFATDGISEPVILEIPKGKYTPVFREREAVDEGDDPAQAELRLRLRRHRIAVATLAICVVVLALSAIWSTLSLRRERMAARPVLDTSPTLRALWSPLLQAPGRTDIVVADSSLSLFQGLLDRQLSLAEYLKPDLWTRADPLASEPVLQRFAQRAAQSRFTSLATVTAAYRIAQLAGRDQSRISFVYPRDFNIRQMKSDNVVLLGSSRANPWTELVQEHLTFLFHYDQQARLAYFENRDPHAGESNAYRSEANVSYCQIVYVPNLSKTGDILAIIGTEVEGTEGGAEFVTSESSLAQLRPLLPAARNGRFPYFEVLLRSSRFAGAAPSFSIIAVRALKA